MDWSSISGITVAVIGILIGQSIEGGNISSLVQPAAFVIVIFGTFGAVLLQTSGKSFIAGLGMAKSIFSPPTDDRQAIADRINTWSHLSRKQGIFLLESHLIQETEPFIVKGLRLMVDGNDPEKIRQICAIDLYIYEMQQRNAAKIWSAAGGYAPTIGILGAVLGLVHVMENLSDPSNLGSGIAVAFVSTIYGVGLANLVFLPIAHKLKVLLQNEIMRREMLINAWCAIASNDHPRIVKDRLDAYLG